MALETTSPHPSPEENLTKDSKQHHNYIDPTHNHCNIQGERGGGKTGIRPQPLLLQLARDRIKKIPLV